jgi:hypothetical protein
MAYRTLSTWIAMALTTATAMAQPATTPTTPPATAAAPGQAVVPGQVVVPQPAAAPATTATANLAASATPAVPGHVVVPGATPVPGTTVSAMPAAPGQAATGEVNWRTPGQGVRQAAAATPSGQAAPRPSIARVTKGTGKLPNDQGQVWRDYDITPYTLRATGTNQPEQAIVDWILRETGYETWHSEPLGLLCANRRTLHVYHTPQVQAIVAEIVDRFVNSEAESQVFSLRVITVGSPNWRAKAISLMTPIPVQSQGVQAWLLAKENAALLLAGLQQRTDYKEHGSPQMAVNNGQSFVTSSLRPRTYVRGIVRSGGAWPGYSPDIAQLDEGYSLEFSPLLSLDGKVVDAVVKLQLNQVEQMVSVNLDMPATAASRQRVRIEVPEMITKNLHERFRWPSDQVLLLSLGVVARPDLQRGNAFTSALMLPADAARADALLMIESKGKMVRSAIPNQPVTRRPNAYNSGRY